MRDEQFVTLLAKECGTPMLSLISPFVGDSRPKKANRPVNGRPSASNLEQ